MSKVIKPTVGRVVLYHPGNREGMIVVPKGGYCAATVCEVDSDTRVNLAVFDANGNGHARVGVRLVQPGEDAPGDSAEYCKWMDYQIGQAAKAEALTDELAKAKG